MVTDRPAPRRLFTHAEATALLPIVGQLLGELRDLKRRLDAARVALTGLTPAMRGNGHGAEALVLERDIAECIARLARGLAELESLGVDVKDLTHGICDFPCKRDGRVVYLCWRLGEAAITHWHELDGGFAGRQPL